MTTRVKTRRVMTSEDMICFAHEKFTENPVRLLSALGIRPAKEKTFCCVHCSSGRGPRGTGMRAFKGRDGELRFYCYACGKTMDAIDLVRETYPELRFFDALCYLVDLYTPKVDAEHDNRLPAPYVAPSVRNNTVASTDVLPDCKFTWARAVCESFNSPEWMRMQADALGLPVSALRRNDVGRACRPEDYADPMIGDLVTFNMLDGEVKTLKVRHDPKLGHGRPDRTYRLDNETGLFAVSPTRIDERSFRQAGKNGEVCFGLQSVTSAISSVVVVEGQTDVLAVCAAAESSNRGDLTAVGRDNAAHVFSAADLNVLAGHNVIYCEDDDNAGRRYTAENLALLRQRGCNVAVWRSPDSCCKDLRDFYCKFGGETLLESLENNK